MHERLRLYDILRVVSLRSCHHEYIHVRVRGSIRSVRNIHNGNVGGSDHNIDNGNVGGSDHNIDNGNVGSSLRSVRAWCPETIGPKCRV